MIYSVLTHGDEQLGGGDVSVCIKVLAMELWFETKQPISFHHRQALSWEIKSVSNGASAVITSSSWVDPGLSNNPMAAGWALAVPGEPWSVWEVLGCSGFGVLFKLVGEKSCRGCCPACSSAGQLRCLLRHLVGA